MFKQLKDVLPTAINKNGLQSEMHALSVINHFNRYCSELMGERSQQNLKCKFCKDKQLYIDAADASWAQHLQINQAGLIEKINSHYKTRAINRFVINIKNI
jgi:hypothetical protein